MVRPARDLLPAALAAMLGAAALAGCDDTPAPAPQPPTEEAAAARAEPRDLPPLDAGSAPLGELLDDARALRWKLPRRLREISGLALTDDGALFAIADERAEIVELDYRHGESLRRFRVGEPVLLGDFEGLAAADELLWAVTSEGGLLSFEPGSHRAHVPYEAFDLGLADRCEIEGLAAEPDRDTLLLVCKEIYDAGEGEIWLFRWSLATGELEPEPLRIDARPLLAALDEDELSPSGIALTPDGSALLLVAARQRAVVRLLREADGRLTVDDVIELPARREHRQAEGIAVLASGAVLIADEGGNDRGRLALYGSP